MPNDDLELIYLTLEDTLELYAAIIDGTTEQAAALLRSRSALGGALARPATYAHYQNADLALQAAVLAHGIAESQALLDGNKRLALVAMLTVLEANGYRVEATDPELAGWIIDLSADLTPGRLAEAIRPRLRPLHTVGFRYSAAGRSRRQPRASEILCRRFTRVVGRRSGS